MLTLNVGDVLSNQQEFVRRVNECLPSQGKIVALNRTIIVLPHGITITPLIRKEIYVENVVGVQVACRFKGLSFYRKVMVDSHGFLDLKKLFNKLEKVQHVAEQEQEHLRESARTKQMFQEHATHLEEKIRETFPELVVKVSLRDHSGDVVITGNLDQISNFIKHIAEKNPLVKR